MVEFMKTMRIVTILCWVIVAVVLLGLAGWFLTGTIIGVSSDRFDRGWPFGSNMNIGGFESLSGPFSADGVYTSGTENINSLNIDWVAGSITIKPYDGDEIRITEFAQRTLSGDEKLHMSTSGGTLNIRYREQGTGLRSIRLPQKRLEVLVPRDFAENLTKLSVGTVSGHVSISDIGSGKVHVDSTSGDISLSNISARELDSNSLSGSISLSNIIADGIGLDSTSGTVTVQSSRAGILGLESLSGLIRVSDSSARSFRAETTSGNINVSGAFDSVNLESLSGRVSLENSFESSIAVVKSTSGAVDLSVSFI